MGKVNELMRREYKNRLPGFFLMNNHKMKNSMIMVMIKENKGLYIKSSLLAGSSTK